VIYTGDLNCPGDSPEAIDTRLDTLLTCYNLVVTNDGPSHLHYDGSQSKLDLMFERDENRRLSEVTTVVVGFSDHRLVKACRRAPAAVVKRTYREYRRFDIDGFRQYLRSLPTWSASAADPDVSAMQLESDLKSAIDKFAPVRTTLKPPDRSRCPWLTADCIQAKRDRCRLERQFSRTRSNDDRLAYRRACRVTNKPFRDARSSFVRQQLEEMRDNPRQLWMTVKSHLHPDQQSQRFEGQNTRQLAQSISALFANKLNAVKTTITSRLASASHSSDVSLSPDPPQMVMSNFRPVFPMEVEHLTGCSQRRHRWM
jgi:hypothetical protein